MGKVQHLKNSSTTRLMAVLAFGVLPHQVSAFAQQSAPVAFAQLKSDASRADGGEREAGEERTIGGMKFVWIPAGDFLMGSGLSASSIASKFGSDDSAYWEDEHPQHRVTISKGFWLGQYEVSQEEWTRVMGDDPSRDGGQLPVAEVSWNDAQKFLSKLSADSSEAFRLPTEAEWEYACRAGTTTMYEFGDDVSSLQAHGWYDRISGGKANVVGQKRPNRWGLHDMHGNVYEWCSDWYGAEHYGASSNVDPTGPSAGETRVVRGGNWGLDMVHSRSAARLWVKPTGSNRGNGFRVVCVPR